MSKSTSHLLPWVARRTTATIRGRTFPAVVLTLVQPQVTEAQYDEFLNERDRYWDQEGYRDSARRDDARAPMVEVIDDEGRIRLEWASYRFIFDEGSKPELYNRKEATQ